jgi:hypothetical protein
MSDGNSIKIPTWALPIGAALVSGAIAWGSMQAQAAATQEEVAEIKVKVEQADTTGKLNAQAIEQITQSLAQMNDPENPNLFCDLREWNNLQLVQPPAYRRTVAMEWLKFNHQQCGYGAMIYIRNSMPRVLGTAHQVDVEMLTWDLVAPQAEKTQAIKKKRRI